MTAETEPKPMKTYDQTLRFWVIFVLSSAAGIILFLTVVQPFLESEFAADRDRAQTIARSYGAQEVSYGHNGMMYVKKNGVLRSCEQLSDAELSQRSPIRCDDGTVLRTIRR